MFQIKLVFAQHKINFSETESITTNMQKRGGGILDIILKTKPICCLIIFSYMPLLRPKTAWAPISSIREQFSKTLKTNSK
jgi:hydroxymethylglutaryl-CoA reductase